MTDTEIKIKMMASLKNFQVHTERGIALEAKRLHVRAEEEFEQAEMARRVYLHLKNMLEEMKKGN